MKKALYWLVGQKAGTVMTATWKWLWGMPVESGGKIAVEVAQESLSAMQQSVRKLTESVAQISASYQQAKAKYESKQLEHQNAEKQAVLAQKIGNEAAARLAIGRAIAIERLLPQLAQQVEQAAQILQTQQQRLNREREQLETYKTDMQNLKDLTEVNQALAAIAQVNSQLDDSARAQFDSAQAAIQGRYLKANALAELLENPAEQASAALDQMTLDDQISRRLQQLNDER